MQRKAKEPVRNGSKPTAPATEKKKAPSKPLTDKANAKSINATTNPKNVQSSLGEKRKPMTHQRSIESVSNVQKPKVTNVKNTVTTVSSPKSISMNKAKPKSIFVSNTTKPVPMRSTYVPKKPPKINEKNVMNRVHNVTVASPPQKRKDYQIDESEHGPESLERLRTQTRTLEPGEAIILKNPPKKLSTSEPEVGKIVQSLGPLIKEPLAFEIKFDEENSRKNVEPKKSTEEEHLAQNSSDDYDYEEDFDSYESDFESASSTKSSSSHSVVSSSSAEGSDSIQHQETITENDKSMSHKNTDDKQMDSGAYDWKIHAESTRSQPNSIGEKESTSGQIDSGIGYDYSTKSQSNEHKSTAVTTQTGAFSKIVKKSTKKMNKRGRELMQKIQLDTMNFIIFELKPLSYEVYMKIYGHVSSSQCSTQTNDNRIDQDTQTISANMRTIWTQWPPNFSSKNILEANFEDRNGYGTDESQRFKIENQCPLEESLMKMNRSKYFRGNDSVQSVLKSIDVDRLNVFLRKASITIAGILATNNNKSIITEKSQIPNCKQFFLLNYQNHSELQGTKIKFLYNNPNITDCLYIVHQCDDFNDKNMISMWNLVDSKAPFKVLTSWNAISALEAIADARDVVVAGHYDGSLSSWNLNDHLGSNIPSHVVLPVLDRQEKSFNDFGRVMTLKSFNFCTEILSKSRQCQIISLHEYGFLTIWTLFQLSATNYSTDLKTSINRLDHQSPWNSMKLIQNQTFSLRQHLTSKTIRPKSGFDKTRSYFENNLFSDAILKELQENDQRNDRTQSDLICFMLELCGDQVYVTTNQNFILCINRSLTKETLKKIVLNNVNYLHGTSLRSLPNHEYMLIGQSNGSVRVLQCKNDINNDKSDQIDVVDVDTPRTSKISFSNDHNLAAKSCAIQNIIKDERRQYNSTTQNVERSDTNKTVDFENNRISAMDQISSSQFVNDQILLHGLSYRQHYTKSIFISRTSNCLYAMCGQILRTFTFDKCEELTITDQIDLLKDAALVRGNGKREFMILLTENDVIQVHMVRGKKEK